MYLIDTQEMENVKSCLDSYLYMINKQIYLLGQDADKILYEKKDFANDVLNRLFSLSNYTEKFDIDYSIYFTSFVSGSRKEEFDWTHLGTGCYVYDNTDYFNGFTPTGVYTPEYESSYVVCNLEDVSSGTIIYLNKDEYIAFGKVRSNSGTYHMYDVLHWKRKNI